MVTSAAEIEGLRPGDHVCWVVDDPATYVERASRILDEATEYDQKPVVFGPRLSPARAALAERAALVADPWFDVLGGRSFHPPTMVAMFRAQTAAARRAGFAGLRLVADMDWLMPAAITTADIVAFEVTLDRVIGEIGATVVCAYRSSSFGAGVTTGAACAHPENIGEDPPFQLVAADPSTWLLSGEVDVAVATTFAPAVDAALADATTTLDVRGLEFIDVAGMRALAVAGRRAPGPVRIVGASHLFRRCWTLTGYGETAPNVELAQPA